MKTKTDNNSKSSNSKQRASESYAAIAIAYTNLKLIWNVSLFLILDIYATSQQVPLTGMSINEIRLDICKCQITAELDMAVSKTTQMSGIFLKPDNWNFLIVFDPSIAKWQIMTIFAIHCFSFHRLAPTETLLEHCKYIRAFPGNLHIWLHCENVCL